MSGPNGFEIGLWHDYFLATGGIGAALAGLVFVAFSINLRSILMTPGVTGRGAEALVLLLGLPLVAIVALWPSDAHGRIGIAIAIVGVALWLEVTGIAVVAARGPRSVTGARLGLRIALGQLGTVPTILAGVSFVTEVGFGLDFLLISAIFGVVGGLIGAWVLLVEILR